MAREVILPGSVVGNAELGRLCRELETLDEQAKAAKIRAKSTGKAVPDDLLQPSHQLGLLATANNCDINVASQRMDLQKDLEAVLDKAPTITLSFAVDPSQAFIAKLVDWFRTAIHPQTLVRIGLQPSITAGFILRTPGKVYDFSLENRFTEQRGMLIERIRAGKTEAITVAPVAVAEVPSE